MRRAWWLTAPEATSLRAGHPNAIFALTGKCLREVPLAKALKI